MVQIFLRFLLVYFFLDYCYFFFGILPTRKKKNRLFPFRLSCSALPSNNSTSTNNRKLSRRRFLHYWSITEHYRHLTTHPRQQQQQQQNEYQEERADGKGKTEETHTLPTKLQLEQILEISLHQSDAHSYNFTKSFTPSSSDLLDMLSHLRNHAEEQQATLPPMPPSKRQSNLQLIQDMFQHAYDSYMYHAYPSPEIKPKSCQPGSFSLANIPAITLIDSLDMLLLMKNYTEFARSVERLRLLDKEMSHQKTSGKILDGYEFSKDSQDKNQKDPSDKGGIFAIDENVSVFETNIRVLGGLLSAHQLAMAYLSSSSHTIESQEELQDDDMNDMFTHSQTNMYLHESHPNPNNRTQKAEKIKDGMIRIPFYDVWDAKHGNIHWGYNHQNSNENQNTDSILGENMGNVSGIINDYKSMLDMNEMKQGVSHFEGSSASSTFPNEFNQPNHHAIIKQVTSITNITASFPASITAKNETETMSNTASNRVWKYDGVLLRFALDIGKRLLPAFQTKTGIPYGTVNLLTGVPHGETPIASLAGAGTLCLEMELLSRLTGDASFGIAAKTAMRALWHRRSQDLNLMGKHINILTGEWTETLSGIGSNSDSFYEYLLKHYLLFPEDEDFWFMFQTAYSGVQKQNKIGDWYSDVDMNHGASFAKYHSILESLMAFYPGLQVLIGEIYPAARTANSIFLVREQLGFLPERFEYLSWSVQSKNNGGVYPLRPELLESGYFLHAATKGCSVAPLYDVNRTSSTNGCGTTGWLWAADFALHAIEYVTRNKCGYCTVHGLSPDVTGIVDPVMFRRKNARNSLHTEEHRIRKSFVKNLSDEMPSFFLSETLKYLYLIFDDNNMLHTDSERSWIFTTEAHPLHYVPPSTKQADVERIYGTIILPDHKNSSSEFVSFEMIKLKLIDKLRHNPNSANVMNEQNEHQNSFDVIEGFGRVVDRANSGKTDTDSFMTERFEPNWALIVHNRRGMDDSLELATTCSNIVHPNSYWNQALSWDAIDYNSFFQTSTSNEDQNPIFNIDPRLLTATSMSALFGTKQLDQYVDDDKCKLVEHLLMSSNTTFQSAHEPLIERQMNTQTLKVGGGLGDFHLTTYFDNPGFSVVQVSTGEEIQIQFYTDAAIVNQTTLIMANYIPRLYLPLQKSNFLLLSRLIPIDTMFTESYLNLAHSHKKSLMSDFSDHLFYCEVVLKNITGDAIALYPCAAASFGPTYVDHLIETNGVDAEAVIYLPDDSDPFGCVNYTKITDVSAHQRRIQLLLRGACPFQHKSIIQSQHNAAAVIIINNEPDRLFIMSRSNDLSSDTHVLEPISVLITLNDGQEIMKRARAVQDRAESLTALVRLKPVRYTSSMTDTADAITWPRIECRDDKIQVLVEGGWGVVAMKKQSRLPFVDHLTHEQGEWQIFIIQHSQ